VRFSILKWGRLALSAIHDRVNTPWTVESLAEAGGPCLALYLDKQNLG